VIYMNVHWELMWTTLPNCIYDLKSIIQNFKHRPLQVTTNYTNAYLTKDTSCNRWLPPNILVDGVASTSAWQYKVSILYVCQFLQITYTTTPKIKPDILSYPNVYELSNDHSQTPHNCDASILIKYISTEFYENVSFTFFLWEVKLNRCRMTIIFFRNQLFNLHVLLS